MSILKSSFIMAIATFFSRILGLVREQVMAAFFGASGLTDAFLVAYRIPNLLRDLFAEGAFSSAFVPTFVEANQESKEKSRELLWALFILLTLITGTLSLGIYIFAPELITIFAPTFVGDAEKFEITVTLTRILAPFLVFVSLAALFMGVLNSLKVFFVPALAPACYNLVSVLAMLLLTSLMVTWGYPGIYSLGIGAILGAFVQAFVQLPLLWRRGYRPVLPKKLFTDKSIKVFKLLGPGLIGFAATQINMLIVTILATGTVAGAVSWLSYSFRLFQLPVGILSVSIGNSNLIHFSQAWKSGKKEEALDALKTSYFLSFFTIMPAMIILYCFADQIVNLIFERGRFGREDTMMTSIALQMYALGLPFYGLYKIWVPVFYTLEKQKVPVMGSLISISVNIIFCLSLTPYWGFKTLALGTGISVLVNSLFLGYIINRELKLGAGFFFNLKLAKIFGVSAFCFVIAHYVGQTDYFDQPLVFKGMFVALEISLLILVYAMGLYFLGERSAIEGVVSKIAKKMKLK